jgi:hemoglobin
VRRFLSSSCVASDREPPDATVQPAPIRSARFFTSDVVPAPDRGLLVRRLVRGVLPGRGTKRSRRAGRPVRADKIARLDESDIYAAVGEAGFERLVAAFYRQVPGDDILGPMYPAHDLAGAEERLREFLIGRFGGPPRYIERRGHPRLRMRHMPFAVTSHARERWLQCMNRALDEARLPQEAERVLREFFDGVSAMLINR